MEMYEQGHFCTASTIIRSDVTPAENLIASATIAPRHVAAPVQMSDEGAAPEAEGVAAEVMLPLRMVDSEG